MTRALLLIAAAVLVLAPRANSQNPFECAPFPWLASIQQPLSDPFPPHFRPDDSDAPSTRRLETKPRERGITNHIRLARAGEAGQWRHRLAPYQAETRSTTYCPTDLAYTFWKDGEWGPDFFTMTAAYNAAHWPVEIREEYDYFGEPEWMESRFAYEGGRMVSYEEEYYFEELWREEYAFDGQGRLSEGVAMEFFDGEWHPAYRVTLSYGEGPWAQGFLGEEWRSGGWQPEYRGAFTYEAGRLTEAHYEAWTGSGWETEDRDTYEYDAAGRVVLAEFEYWQQRILIDYDAQGRMLTWEEQSGYDGWQTETVFEYAYGSHSAPTELVIHYASFDQVLEPYARLRYAYEGGLFESVEHDYFEGGTWLVSDRETLTRDAQARPVERVFQGYGGGAWHNSTRVTYGYDGATSTEPAPLAAVVEMHVAPNPARVSAALFIDLAAPADVRVDLFDVLGRRVQRIHSGEMPAGSQRTGLDLAPLAPGVYVVRVETGGQVITRRLTVVR